MLADATWAKPKNKVQSQIHFPKDFLLHVYAF